MPISPLKTKSFEAAIGATMNPLYRENDKIMILETGEVVTVVADFSEHLERGLIVKENIGRNLSSSEVRPAGRTRERTDAGRGVVAPEPFPPPPIGEADFV